MKREPVRIFLAEDNSADVLLIEEALTRQSLNYAIDHYETAEDAVRAASACGHGGVPVPDLLLLDYNLPGGQGSDVLAAAAANPQLAEVPKAILSSFLRPAELRQAQEMGVHCFIAKPANLTDFLKDVGERVVQLLQLRGKTSVSAGTK
jgi:CheY-like chemotaxis protein